MNFPLKCLLARGSGIGSSVLFMSNNTSATRSRMPFKAFDCFFSDVNIGLPRISKIYIPFLPNSANPQRLQ
mgnify:CR=1 FL=1